MIDDVPFLYVEDDPNSRRVMKILMTDVLGISQLEIFSDSENFRERLLALDPPPQIVFLDIQMKPLTGFEMLAVIREQAQFKDTPVIALTASVMNEEVQKLRDHGFNGTISKPLDINAFPDLLARIMRGEPVWHIN